MVLKFAQYVLGEGTLRRSVKWATGQKNTDALTVMAITQQQQKAAQMEKE